MPNKTLVFADTISACAFRRLINVYNICHTYSFPNFKYFPYYNFIKINGIIYFSSNSDLLLFSLFHHQPITQIAYVEPKTEHGYRTVKKRSNAYDNPIWMIDGIEFNADKFNKDMASFTNNNNDEKAQDKFDQAFSELLSSKYDPPAKVFNV